MIDVLRKYLDKLKVKDFTELHADERATYNKWMKVFEKEVTLKTLGEFTEKQIKELYKSLKESVKKGENRKALLATAKIENYEAMLDFITEPERSKENLKTSISKLLADIN